MMLPPNIILIGFMGSGKTVTGRELAKKLHFLFWDMDHWIERKNKASIPEIFNKKGEKYFRKEEIEAVHWLANRNNYIVSVGGGAWIPKGNRKRLLKLGWCIWLEVSAKDVLERISPTLPQRPLLSKSKNLFEEINKLLSKRNPLYSGAHARINTHGKNPKEVAGEIIEIFKKSRPFDLPQL